MIVDEGERGRCGRRVDTFHDFIGSGPGVQLERAMNGFWGESAETRDGR